MSEEPNIPQFDGDDLQPVLLCGRCRAGEGGECHTPGCALWINRAPDIPVDVDPELVNHRAATVRLYSLLEHNITGMVSAEAVREALADG